MFIRFCTKTAAIAALLVALCVLCSAQTGAKTGKTTIKRTKKASLPKVTQIDLEGLKKLLKPKGKPLLINFWATWCDPCREEFPDLVKLDAVYKGRIDFVTVSLDDFADIKTYVPKFLAEMNSKIPAYLLHTPDESAAITEVSNEWRGNLPFTILMKPTGETVYRRSGKLRYEVIVGEIDKLVTPPLTPLTNKGPQ